MVKKDVFLMKPKPQYHLSQWGECIWVPNHEKKKEIILWIHAYPIQKQTLILKMVERNVFFWSQNLIIIYPNEENAFMAPNHKKKGDYIMNPCLSKSANER